VHLSSIGKLQNAGDKAAIQQLPIPGQHPIQQWQFAMNEEWMFGIMIDLEYL
jgi:hypothetical protein